MKRLIIPLNPPLKKGDFEDLKFKRHFRVRKTNPK
jgi:hypothetical protein